MTPAGKIPVEARKTTLQLRLADLKARIAAIEAELESHTSRDWDELAQEREGDEVLEASGSSAKSEIRRIEAALSRIDEGEYGYCVHCGAEIGDDRLDALPFTPFCRACAH
ncbi:MAG: TraR/DksA family transcriptional regulator [Rhodobacteraceae bacterium]|jgi:RNA polymerase-binding transcription factor DksA|nr:TraR/DksA family transcriptional regulator [Paracoccaceae bacterium]